MSTFSSFLLALTSQTYLLFSIVCILQALAYEAYGSVLLAIDIGQMILWEWFVVLVQYNIMKELVRKMGKAARLFCSTNVLKATMAFELRRYADIFSKESLMDKWQGILSNPSKILPWCPHLVYINKMPPKKIGQKTQGSQDRPKTVEKQTKLFQSQQAKEPEESSKNPKSRSKQFHETSTDKSKNHTNLWEYGNGKTPNKLFISSWNVNGIRSVLNKKDLQNYLEKSKPDIICFNETKIDHTAFEKEPIQLTGYHGYWNFCKCSAGYSGVAIFSKYLPLSVTEDLPQNEHSQQGRVITVEFQEFYLITAYIPNSGQKLDRLQYRVNEYDKCFQQYCNELKKKKTVIICGDLNVCHKEIDIARPKGNQKTAGFTIQERESFTKFLETGWIDTFRKFYPTEVKYSWWSMRTGGRAKNIGWRLDYFLIDDKSSNKVKDSTINNDIMGSDHCPIQLSLQLK